MTLAEWIDDRLLDEELVLLLAAYQNQLGLVADAASVAVREEWRLLDSADRNLIVEFEKVSRPIVTGARLEGSDLANGLLHELTGEFAKTVDIADLAAPAYDAPFLRTWHNLSEGAPWKDAFEGGGSQAEAIGHDAPYDGANFRMGNSKLRLVGARRVLSKGACRWCQLASVQKYKSIESASFGHGGRHDKRNCRCVAVGIYGKRDPGRTLNRRRYAELKASGTVAELNAARR